MLMYSEDCVHTFEYFREPLYALKKEKRKEKEIVSPDSVVIRKQSNRRGYLNLVPTSYGYGTKVPPSRDTGLRVVLWRWQR